MNVSTRVCVQACTQGTIIPMDAPDIPPPPTREVHLKPTSVNHTIHVPNLSPPRPPPRHAHGSDRVLILLLCKCMDDNAQHTMERHAAINEPSGDNCVYTGQTVLCNVPVMHAHCLNPMHTLLLPISRNSILLLRPNHQILFPGNFYPFMLLTICATKATRSSQSRIWGKNPVFLVLGFRLFSPVS